MEKDGHMISLEALIKLFNQLPKSEPENRRFIHRLLPEQSNDDFISEISTFFHTMEDFQSKFPESRKVLAQKGWFLDSEYPMEFSQDPSMELVQKLESNGVEWLDDHFLAFYRPKVESILQCLISRYPQKEGILEEIRFLYQNNKYNGGIVLLFTLTDGICYDYCKKNFFKKKNGVLEITNEFTTWLDFFLGPMKETCPVFANTKDLNESELEFNRHAIIHGITTTYGNELNFIKSVCLIKYVSDILENEKVLKGNIAK
jgi:hypothetical protein